MKDKLIRILAVVGILVGGWFFIENIQVASKNLTAILPVENTVNADNIGVYFWAGQAGESQNDIIQTGSDLLQDLGASNIRITISPKSDIDYKDGSCIANFSLKGLAQRNDFRGIISDPKFKTIMITVNDGVSFPDCFTKNYLNPDFYTPANTQKIQQEYIDFARFLATFSDKTFIISNWEGDNDIYCGAAFGATPGSCPNHQRALAGFKKWASARTAGIKASGAGNVFSAVEFNIVRDLKDRGLPSVLYDVIPNVDADYFSYSSYESINPINDGDGGARFRDDIGVIRQALNSAGKQSVNLIIGEYGFGQGSRENIKNKIEIATRIISEAGIKYAFVWNLLDAGGPFGLYDSSANLVAAGEYFCDLWNGSACGPKLTFTNITEPTRNPRFWVIDSWRLSLSGAPPSAPVRLCAEQNGQSLGCTPVEDIGFAVEPTTDSGGNWVLENSWTGFDENGLYGTWKEWAEIGGVKSTAARFKIQTPDLRSPSAFYIPEDERSDGGGAGGRVDKTLGLIGGGGSYERQLDAEGGTEPYTWEIIRGELPAGLNMNPDGLISGELTGAKDSKNVAHALDISGIGVRVTDASNPRRQAAADIIVAATRGDSSAGGSSGSLVPCGRLPGPGVPEEETRPCQICDTFELIDRVWKFLLTVLVPGAAIVFYIGAGVLILLYGANPSLQATGKNLFKTTTYGLIIILGAWMLTNTVMRSLAGDSINRDAPWYVIQCVNPAQPGPVAQRRYVCGSTGCVARSDGEFDNFEACRNSCSAQQTQAGTCTGVSCAPDALSCSPANPGDGCDAAAVNALSSDIATGAGSKTICSGVDTTKLLKAIIANESDGRVNLVSSDGLSAGPFQLTVETADNYKSACGVTEAINFDWLKRRDTVAKQACIAAEFLKSLVGACGCNVRQLAAGYNGGGKGKGACAVSTDCGPAAASAGGQCSMCSNQSGPTKRWECLWNNLEHTVCNKDRIVDGKPASFAPTRLYAPRVEYCYSQFGGATTSNLTCPVTIKPWSGADPYIESFSGPNDQAAWQNTRPELRSALEAVRARYPNVRLISTWRPQEYQDHIRSVWDAVRFVDGRSVTVPTSYGSCSDAGTTYPAPQGWQNCTSFKSTVNIEASPA